MTVGFSDAVRLEAVMKLTRWNFAILFCLAVASVAQAQPPANQERIDALVRNLGSASFVQREQAGKELESVGPAALESLRRAAKTSDAETARRVGELIRRFEEQLLTKQILAPKEVDLKLEGVTVQQAIADLQAKSGYALQFQGDATPFADKKITLTGKMAFWQAFDKLCDQAGLMEVVDLKSAPQADPTRLGRGRFVYPPQTAPAGPIRLTLSGKEKSDGRAKWNETKVTLDVNGKSWSDALAWLCKKSGEPLVGKLAAPQGTVKFKSEVDKDGKPREYTLIEVYDIFNDRLMADHKFFLLRRENALLLLPIDAAYEAPPVVKIEGLPDRGRTEIVEIVIDLRKELNAEEFAPQAKRLLGEGARVTPIPETNQLIIRASVGSILRNLSKHTGAVPNSKANQSKASLVCHTG
jgi:hypothetical protein